MISTTIHGVESITAFKHREIITSYTSYMRVIQIKTSTGECIELKLFSDDIVGFDIDSVKEER